MQFELPELNYAFDALEPYMDAKTMEIHHTKHHLAYCDNFNKALIEYPFLYDMSAKDILRNLNKIEINDQDKEKIKNHGGGYINHNLFFDILGHEKDVNEELNDEINKNFESVENFKKYFTETANKHFGSGWTWLVKDESNKLRIYSLTNQDSPLTLGHEPIINLDLWEHAYYLKYQNKRAEYIDAYWNVLKIL